MFRADYRISLVTAQSLCQARYGLRSRVGWHGLPFQLRAVPAVACWHLKTIGHFQYGHFGTETFTVGIILTIAPRLLSCLRIKQPITGLPARLDTWPVANGYQGGIYTRSIVQHCQAAT